MKHPRNITKRVRLAVVGVASFVLLVTVLPQIASSIGLSSLANRLDAASSCSSSGSSSASASSSSSCSSSSSSSSGLLDGSLQGTVTVKGVPRNVKIKYIYVYACPVATPWTSGNPPATCAATQSAKKSSSYDFAQLLAGAYVLHPGYISNLGSWTRVKANKMNPLVTILPTQTTTKDMTVQYHS
jgi:hypothetical protein